MYSDIVFNRHGGKSMTKDQIIQTMRNKYMPNYFDKDMFDYTTLNDEEVYNIYLEECENYGKEEVNEILQSFNK